MSNSLIDYPFITKNEEEGKYDVVIRFGCDKHGNFITRKERSYIKPTSEEVNTLIKNHVKNKKYITFSVYTMKKYRNANY